LGIGKMLLIRGISIFGNGKMVLFGEFSILGNGKMVLFSVNLLNNYTLI